MKHIHVHPEPPFPYGGRRAVPHELLAPAVVVKDLCCKYESAAAVLQDVGFTLTEGTATALVGPNGAGKSTILKTIAGLLQPHAGTVGVFGLKPGTCHHRTAYLPQRGEIDWSFPITVESLVLTGRYVHLGWFRRIAKVDREIAARVIDRLGLRDEANSPIGTLSGGRQQRALIGRALAQGSELLLLDEPFNNLDSAARRDLLGLFGELTASGKTLLVATHDFEKPEEVFDRVLRVDAGRVSA